MLKNTKNGWKINPVKSNNSFKKNKSKKLFYTQNIHLENWKPDAHIFIKKIAKHWMYWLIKFKGIAY